MTTARRNAAAPKKDPKAKDPKRAWMFVVDLPPDISGTGPRRKQVLRRGFATKAQAQAALDALRVNARKGQHVDRSTITVEQYLEESIAGLPGPVRPSTAASYEAMLRSHVIPRIGGAPLQSFGRLSLRRCTQRYGHRVRTSVTRAARQR
ncbi:MAG: Arm DNA-binding domain-containing protein [Microthrixaceae bacterium]